MAKERCLKKAFQDSLEDIKERMKEKRTKKLAKVATVSKALCTKVKIINNTATTAKSFQANNKALALALEAEKFKTRQAQDLILHLKRDQQRLMFDIFLLKRKLNMQQGSNQAEAKLASLKEIIAKVTNNLLETANLLEPAHALCLTDHSTGAPSAVKRCSGPRRTSESLAQSHMPALGPGRNIGSVVGCSSNAETRKSEDAASENSDNGPAVKRLSRGRKYSLNQQRTDDESSETETTDQMSYLKNVSVRRRASSLDVCIEESTMDNLTVGNHTLNSMIEIPEPQPIASLENSFNKSCNGEEMETCLNQSPSKEEIGPFTKLSQICSSTPEPKTKQMSKGKNESRPGREKARKSKTDGGGSVPLKKPWEKTKARGRSKSRERGAGKSGGAKDKMNSSLNSGDAYDFVFEESIHVTPFRQGKQSKNPEENKDPEKENVNKSSCTSEEEEEEETDDSLYLPSNIRSRNRSSEKITPSLPLRPRSKRSKLQQSTEKKENRSSDRIKRDAGNAKKNQSTTSNVQEINLQSRFSGTAKPQGRSKENALKCEYDLELEHGIDIHVDTEDLIFPASSIHEPDGAVPSQRISLSDVTNLSLCSGSKGIKKHSFPFSTDGDRKLSGTSMRKRRSTAAINYAEPSLIKKLRRGDPFTDTEFLSSPIFKNRKSLNRNSLARYNEAFVGCRR